MTKQVRWKCGHCESGVLAPSKPRRDDVRRYCLPCSQRTGKLVERTSPTLEKQRERRAAFVNQKVQRKREQQKQINNAARNEKKIAKQRAIKINNEAKRIWRYMEPFHKGRPLPRIVIAEGRGSQNGHATYWLNQIQINVDREQGEYKGKRVWHVLAHELAHCAAPPVITNGNRDVHHRMFYQCLKHAFEKRWKCAISFHEVTTYGYSVDAIIMKQARQHINWELPN